MRVTSGALDLSAAQWLGIVVFVALAALASTRIGGIWRGEIETYAEPSRRNRSLPAWFVAGWVMVIALGPTVYVLSRNGPVPWWAAFLLLVALTAAAVSVLLASLVWLIGRPRSFVPPPMRNQAE
jgi:hypothetical protein